MPRSVPLAFALLLVLTAGCVSDSGPSEWTVTPSDDGSSVTGESDDRGTERVDDAPELSNETAKERALHAEERYLERRLANEGCVAEWGTWGTVTSEEATLRNHSVEGVTVDVKHPYWWGNDDVSYDGASRARYLVTPDVSTRLDGDRVDPC